MAISTYTLDQFIADMQELVDAQADQAKIFDRGSAYLERLVTTPEAIPEEFRVPSGQAGGRITAATRSIVARACSSARSSGGPAITSARTITRPGA